MAKTFWKGLEKSAGVGFDRPSEVIKFTSPGLNFLFGPYGGVPLGFTACFWGGIRGGKTSIIYDAISNLHKNDPTAAAILFDTEMRSGIQNGGSASRNIDPERLLVKQTNSPMDIFNFIEHDVPAAMDEGLNLKLLAIDSVSLIRGRRSLNADTIETQQIGDRSLTIQEGMGRILPVLRRKKIALLLTSQARAQLDPIQVMMKKTKKMDGSFGLLHLVEFVVQVDQIESQAGKIYNETLRDQSDKPILEANKVRVTLGESSCGGKGRVAECTLSYEKGFINLGQEVTNLGLNLGVIHKPDGGNSLVYKDVKHRSVQAFADALEVNDALRDEIVAEIMLKTKIQE
jgi:RecA/RadA recombinase